MTSGQETERVYSYNPGTCRGSTALGHVQIITHPDAIESSPDFFTCQIPFLLRNQQCSDINGETFKISHKILNIAAQFSNGKTQKTESVING